MHRSRVGPRLLLVASLVVAAIACSGKQRRMAKSAAEAVLSPESHLVRPEKRELTPELLARLRVPEGFEVSVFATGLGNARMLLTTPAGEVLVTRPKQGDVLSLEDSDGDGRSDRREVLFTGMEGVHGIALHEGTLFLATPTTVWVAKPDGQGGWSPPTPLVEGLPEGAQHPHRTLGVGPDGRLYISVGSSCNDCDEKNPDHAKLLRVNLDGSGRESFASGLRNTMAFAWHPDSGELWGMDQGVDHRGDELPPEELNRLFEDGNYGWPYVFGDRQPDPEKDPPEGFTREEYAAGTEPMVLGYQAHSSPISILFYTGTQFPTEYRHDAFVTMRGSWNRRPPTGFKVVRVKFEGGQPTAFEDFLTGFLIEEGPAQFARIAGLAQAPDGSLLVSDDEGGVIYRIAYRR